MSVSLKSKFRRLSAREENGAIYDLEESSRRGDIQGCFDASLKLYLHDPERYEQIFRRHDFARTTLEVEKYFGGEDYRWWLKWFHDTLQPRMYLEIGVESGATMSLANQDTRCVGVDPVFHIQSSITAWNRLYQLPSDEFFATVDTRALFGGGLDFVFIDGLHTFDQVLRDFINVEKVSLSETIVVFHDVLPVEPRTALRERETVFWLGDVWKFILIIGKYRPDLKFFTIPTKPSGLFVVYNLNPNNDGYLRVNHDRIVDEYLDLDFVDFSTELLNKMNLCENNEASVLKAFDLSTAP